jgi:UDP-N-acetylglucosamine--N-acetylmuramyl-(pentapeptide) pyrophosphoryl-undecaprenol N-acetylglucosamine transferase
MSTCVLIAAGGTGGHVFPGIALADALVARADVTPVFVGTVRGFESSVVPTHGYTLETFEVSAIMGGGPIRAIRGAASAAGSLAHAVRFLRARAPAVVIGIGGYAAGPVAMAAIVLGVPLVIVEPNSVMGLSNRLVAPLARRIYIAWGEVRVRLGRAEVRRYGVPLRAGFVPRRYEATDTRRVLVLGGSQGAQALNERLPEALGRLGLAHLEVLHQAGEGKEASDREAYLRANVRGARVVAFSSRPEDDLAWADVVVARAGAGTLAEIAAVGRASLLIPFPHAADDHQAKNAAAYAREGAAMWVRQNAADSTRIGIEVARLLADGALRERMAARALSLGQPEAAGRIADDVLQLAGITGKSPLGRSTRTASPVALRAS